MSRRLIFGLYLGSHPRADDVEVLPRGLIGPRRGVRAQGLQPHRRAFDVARRAAEHVAGPLRGEDGLDAGFVEPEVERRSRGGSGEGGQCR